MNFHMNIKETRISVNGYTLHFRFIERDASLPWLFMFHGFLGSGEQFCPVAESFSAHVNICLPDLIGFGKSDVPADILQYTAAVQVNNWLEILESGYFGHRVILHGYSMGGRLALRLAIRINAYKNGILSETVKGLILESTTPGLRDKSERLERAKMEALMVQEIRADLPGFLTKWKTNPLFKKGKSSALLEKIQSDTNPAGAAASLTSFGSGSVEPVWNELENLNIPVLILAGESDLRYRSIAIETEKQIKYSTLQIIECAGHRIHSDNPEQYISAIIAWIQKIV
ncbi:MAG: alpha/beta fold hydrolase [Cyclonatronaceae bacterium]